MVAITIAIVIVLTVMMMICCKMNRDH